MKKYLIAFFLALPCFMFCLLPAQASAADDPGMAGIDLNIRNTSGTPLDNITVNFEEGSTSGSYIWGGVTHYCTNQAFNRMNDATDHTNTSYYGSRNMITGGSSPFIDFSSGQIYWHGFQEGDGFACSCEGSGMVITFSISGYNHSDANGNASYVSKSGTTFTYRINIANSVVAWAEIVLEPIVTTTTTASTTTTTRATTTTTRATTTTTRATTTTTRPPSTTTTTRATTTTTRPPSTTTTAPGSYNIIINKEERPTNDGLDHTFNFIIYKFEDSECGVLSSGNPVAMPSVYVAAGTTTGSTTVPIASAGSYFITELDGTGDGWQVYGSPPDGKIRKCVTLTSASKTASVLFYNLINYEIKISKTQATTDTVAHTWGWEIFKQNGGSWDLVKTASVNVPANSSPTSQFTTNVNFGFTDYPSYQGTYRIEEKTLDGGAIPLEWKTDVTGVCIDCNSTTTTLNTANHAPTIRFVNTKQTGSHSITVRAIKDGTATTLAVPIQYRNISNGVADGTQNTQFVIPTTPKTTTFTETFEPNVVSGVTDPTNPAAILEFKGWTLVNGNNVTTALETGPNVIRVQTITGGTTLTARYGEPAPIKSISCAIPASPTVDDYTVTLTSPLTQVNLVNMAGYTVNWYIDWGDSSTLDHFTSPNAGISITHTYPSPGERTINLKVESVYQGATQISDLSAFNITCPASTKVMINGSDEDDGGEVAP